MLDLHQLEVFITAAELLNFSQAGSRLHISQPSVTQHIQSLESQLGNPLFIRQGKKLALTEAGSLLLPIARRLVLSSMRAEETLESLTTEVSGHLHVGCSTTPGKYRLPRLMADFMRANPHVQATCSVTSRSQVLRLLEKGSVDFAFTSSTREFNQYTEFKKFLSDPVLLIVHPNHPWATLGQIQLEDLRTERFIMREDSSGTYEVTRTSLAQAGFNIHDLQVILTLGNSEAIAMAVMQQIGVGFISQSVVQNFICGRVIPIQIEGIQITQEIYFCRNKLHTMGNAQSKFWSFILSQAEASEPIH